MKKDKIQELIGKLFSEATSNNIESDCSLSAIDVIRFCEKENILVEAGPKNFWGFVKTIKNEKPYIRMVFAMREECKGRVRNIEQVTKMISYVERVVSYIDECISAKEGNYIYLDIMKKIPERVKNDC